MSERIKACPYCADPHPSLEVQECFVAVECMSCGARGPVFGDETVEIRERKVSAVRAWNGPWVRR